MASSTLVRHSVAIDEVLGRFLAARAQAHTARRARAYAALMDDLKDYLGRYRLRELPCDPASGSHRVLEAELLGQLHREQRAAIDAFLEIADDFGDSYLCDLGVDRATLRLAEAMVRELGRWLRTARLVPSESTKKRAPHLSCVEATSPRSSAPSRGVRVLGRAERGAELRP